ncbi:glycosyltransferase [Parvularcula marina]|uniref:glycosyltransferase n=1 Tax=Parvularcula marina TaxID=2292771 RepID=UPI00351996A6
MPLDKKKAYLNFCDFLDMGQERLAEEIDIREKILSLRQSDITVGYMQENLQSAYGSNLKSLFPKIRGIEGGRLRKTENNLALGTIYSDPERSHAGACHVFSDDDPNKNIFLIEIGFLASTQGWSHSFKEKRPELACLGYIYDDIAHYFMADYPNRLIQKLNSDAELSEAESARAEGLIRRIVDRKISKYNAQPFTAPAMTEGYSRRVLVCDQSYADASTIYGKINTLGFESMLLAAIQENPDAEILVKSHPDIYWEKSTRRRERSGYFEHLRDAGRVRILREPVNPYTLFDLVDTVYVGTSQMGLEALFAGKKVVCFGAPFYAGWGLTDDRQPVPHRHRNRSLIELFHYFYDWYTIYHVPGCAVPSRIEDALDFIEQHRPYAPPIALPATERPPKISVILPVYGVEQYIEECLRSIQRQTLEDIEIIPVNDQSPDGSQAIIDRLAADDPRIRPIIMKENVGQGFARNAGIEAARGEFIWFIDSDDYLASPTHLETVFNVACEDSADLVRGRKNIERIEDSSGQHLRDRRDETEKYFDENFQKKTFAEAPVLLHSRHHCLWLYRREFLQESDIKFTTPKWEERPFLLKALLSAKCISTTSSEAFIYRIRQDSTARREKTAQDYEDQIKNFEDVVELLSVAGAFERSSELWCHANFTIAQYIHYIFCGFPYELVSAGKLNIQSEEFFDRIRKVLLSTNVNSSDLVFDAYVFSKSKLKPNVYRLIFAAIKAEEYDLARAAIEEAPISQEKLYTIYKDEPCDEFEADLQYALNLYARNGLAKELSARPDVSLGALPRIVIHIGATKTGSTFLQHYMDQNRPALLREGIWYPERGLFQQEGRPHKIAGHANFAPAAVRNKPFLLNYLLDGLRLMKGRVHTIVLSSEAFFLNAKADMLAEYFRGFDVQMIAYLRRQDEWANAQYAEFVAGGAVGRIDKEFTEWLESAETAERLNYLNVLNRWNERIGRENIIVRPYERSQFVDGDLIADFAAAANLPALTDLPRPEKGKSNSFPLGSEHLPMFRHFNKLSYPSREAYLDFVEEATSKITAYREEIGLPISKPWALEDGQSEQILADHASVNELIARHYMGREDGRLFEDMTPRAGQPAPTTFDAREFEILSTAYEHQLKKAAARKPKPKAKPAAPQKVETKTVTLQAVPKLAPGAVNYGLFGWRKKILAPIVGRYLKPRIPSPLYRIYDKEPSLYFNSLPHVNRNLAHRVVFPRGSVYGPLGITKIWVPIASTVIGAWRGDRMRSAFEQDPVMFFRNARGGMTRLIGRLLFPFGERPEDVREELRAAGFVYDWHGQHEHRADQASRIRFGQLSHGAAE